MSSNWPEEDMVMLLLYYGAKNINCVAINFDTAGIACAKRIGDKKYFCKQILTQ